MKKWIVVLILSFFSIKGLALPVGNPKEADLFWKGLYFAPTAGWCDFCSPCFNWCDAWSIRAGFYGDYVFNRSLKVRHILLPEGRRKKIERSRIFTNASYVALNICNRVDLFTTLGVTDFHFRQDAVVFESLASFESDLDFSSAFSWSIGGRMTLWEIGRIAIGIEGQYFNAYPHLDHFHNYSSGSIVHFDQTRRTYTEWQVGLGLSYHIATNCPSFGFIPYGAIKYSNAHLDLRPTTFFTEVLGVLTPLTLHNVHSRRPWGAAIGISFTMGSLTGLTVEADFGDETACYVNGQVRF